MTLIYPDSPATWQELEERVAEILRECEYDVDVHKTIQLARGHVNVDVWADDHSSPPNIIVVECKNWSYAATKTIVHAFRTVVGDSGASLGLIVSSGGFHEGAVEAAAYSNIRLLDWPGFQSMFAIRWLTKFMEPTINRETDPLYEYTEPMNSRIFRKVNALSESRQKAFTKLRGEHDSLAMVCLAFGPSAWHHLSESETSLPELPLRNRLQQYRLLRSVDEVAVLRLSSEVASAQAHGYGCQKKQVTADQVFKISIRSPSKSR